MATTNHKMLEDLYRTLEDKIHGHRIPLKIWIAIWHTSVYDMPSLKDQEIVENWIQGDGEVDG